MFLLGCFVLYILLTVTSGLFHECNDTLPVYDLAQRVYNYDYS